MSSACAHGPATARLAAERQRRIETLEAERNALRQARRRAEARVQELEARLALLRSEVRQLRSGRWRTVRLGEGAPQQTGREAGRAEVERVSRPRSRAGRTAPAPSEDSTERAEPLVLRVHGEDPPLVPSDERFALHAPDGPSDGSQPSRPMADAEPSVEAFEAAGTPVASGAARAADAPAPRPEALERYRDALRNLRSGRFDAAHRLLSDLQGRSLSPRLREGVLYWSAEALYGLARYREALERFERFVARYPASRRAPDALWKVSLCRGRLGDDAGARRARQRLLARYATSVAARMAAREEDRI